MKIDEVIGISKAYTTRVGAGPFPTELEEDEADKLRKAGNEFGATTGRPRRCGWFDGVVIKRAVQLNSITMLTITKLDVLSSMQKIRIGLAYKIGGKEINSFPSDLEALSKARPVYEEMEGWQEDISGITSYEKLPEKAQKYLKRLGEIASVPVKLVSVGPKRPQTIVIK
jgi:adenylosuccinate synthase